MQDINYIKKADNCVDLIADSTLTIPVRMGNEIFCTINFMKHKMDLQINDEGQFNNVAKLTKEIFASITLTEAHAIQLSNIISEQIEALKKTTQG